MIWLRPKLGRNFKKGKYMAYVLYNEIMFMKNKSKGNEKIQKTENIEEAQLFKTAEEARQMIGHAVRKLRGYKVYYLDDKGRIMPVVLRKQIKQRKQIYERDKGICGICGRNISFQEMTIDHIIPLAKGGRNEPDNFQCACRYCNSMKQDFYPEEFRQKIFEIYEYQILKEVKGQGRSLAIRFFIKGVKRMM